MFVVLFLLALVFSTVLSFFRGWMLMLAIGIIHAEWLTGLPTLGYWWAVVIAILLGAAFTRMDTSSDRK